MPIKSEVVEVTMNGSNMGYYKNLGYTELKRFKVVSIRLQDLPSGSNAKVHCSCDDCGSEFHRRYEGLTRDSAKGRVLCQKCRYVASGKAVTISQTGQKRPSILGDKNPNYSNNKTEFQRYCRAVTRATYANKHIYSTWDNFDKIGRCGVDGAYQLDHIMPKRFGFENNIPPETVGGIQNLQLIPWEANRNKGYKYTEEMIQWHLS